MIQTRHLSVRYRPNRLAIDDVSFRISPGEVYALLGAPGAGKTTVVNALRGAVRPERGAALVGDLDVEGDPIGGRRRLGFIVGPGALYGDLSPRQNVRLFVRAAGQPAQPTPIDNALRRMGVPEHAFDAPARALDARLHLAVSFATAFLRGVSGLVLDGPTDGADAVSSQHLEESLDEFRSAGTAVLVTTSDLSLAAAVSDRVGILRAGRLAAECTPERLLAWSLPEFLLEFTGARSTAPPPARYG